MASEDLSFNKLINMNDNHGPKLLIDELSLFQTANLDNFLRQLPRVSSLGRYTNEQNLGTVIIRRL